LFDIYVSDVSFPGKQPALPAQSVAADGGTSAVCQGIRTASVGDIHARSQQGVHHVETRLCRNCSQVYTFY